MHLVVIAAMNSLCCFGDEQTEHANVETRADDCATTNTHHVSFTFGTVGGNSSSGGRNGVETGDLSQNEQVGFVFGKLELRIVEAHDVRFFDAANQMPIRDVWLFESNMARVWRVHGMPS